MYINVYICIYGITTSIGAQNWYSVRQTIGWPFWVMMIDCHGRWSSMKAPIYQKSLHQTVPNPFVFERGWNSASRVFFFCLVDMKLVRKNSLRLHSLSVKLEAYLPCQVANHLLAILEGATLFTKDLIHLFTHSLHIPQHFTRATFKCLNWCVASQCQDDHWKA